MGKSLLVVERLIKKLLISEKNEKFRIFLISESNEDIPPDIF
jgi:hypothetical protein